MSCKASTRARFLCETLSTARRVAPYFYDNHYRRFIVLSELMTSLRKYGYLVEYAEEKTGFAPHGNDDPPVIRLVAVKP